MVTDCVRYVILLTNELEFKDVKSYPPVKGLISRRSCRIHDAVCLLDSSIQAIWKRFVILTKVKT